MKDKIKEEVWISFADGHKEVWSDTRLQNELDYNGLVFLKKQIMLTEIFARKDERQKAEKEIQTLKDTIQDRIKFENEQEKHIEKLEQQKKAMSEKIEEMPDNIYLIAEHESVLCLECRVETKIHDINGLCFRCSFRKELEKLKGDDSK